jgi:flagellar hook assembly protein FlgD
MPREASVRLELHDVRGRAVRRLTDGAVLPAGIHHLSWDGRDEAGREAAPGVYFATVSTGGASATRRILRIRG